MRAPDINEEEWRAWLTHPVTAAYRQYLRDRRQALMADWADGVLLGPMEQGGAVALGALSGVDWADIMAFYEEQE